MTLVQPLDIQNLFVDKLIGTGPESAIVFFFIFLAFLSVLSARFRMPGLIFSMLVVIFISIFTSNDVFSGGLGRFAIALVILGISFMIGRNWVR